MSDEERDVEQEKEEPEKSEEERDEEEGEPKEEGEKEEGEEPKEDGQKEEQEKEEEDEEQEDSKEEDYDDFDKSFANAVIADGLPVVSEDKHARLVQYCKKTFEKWGGEIIEIDLPLDDQKQTCGFAFLEYKTHDQAKEAQSKLDNLRFDAKHIVRATMFDDYNRIMEMSNEFAPLQQQAFERKMNLRSFLEDEELRDQFVVRHDNETEVWWNDPLRKAVEGGRSLCYSGARHTAEGKNWTDLLVAWSPLGSYLATYHREGIILWGGDRFEQVARFRHIGVQWIDFSPQETYLVTSNGRDAQNPSDPECIIVWDIKTGKKKRGFNKDFSPYWPIFKWSHDDRFAARVGENKILVYETPSMGLLEKQSIKVPRVHEVQWSPSEYILAYWLPEEENEAASIGLLEIPGRKIHREVHLFTGSSLCPARHKDNAEGVTCNRMKPCTQCRMTIHWQSAGEYLAVKMTRRQTKIQKSDSIHLFRVNEKKKSIPVEVVEVGSQVFAMAWEPNNKRFAVAHGEAIRPSVSFYSVTPSAKVKLLDTLDSRPVNRLFWSPRGHVCVLAGLGAFNGQLEFYDVENSETLTAFEHFMCTDVSWDPSGRYVITAVTQPLNRGKGEGYRYTMENGYKLWTMHGEPLATKIAYDSLYQVLWRPRPPRLLSPQEQKEVKRNLKGKYYEKFAKEDEELESLNLGEEKRARKELETKWKKYREECIKEYNSEADGRDEICGVPPEELVEVEEISEEVVEELTEKFAS